jgi:hypothetical protein
VLRVQEYVCLCVRKFLGCLQLFKIQKADISLIYFFPFIFSGNKDFETSKVELLFFLRGKEPVLDRLEV